MHYPRVWGRFNGSFHFTYLIPFHSIFHLKKFMCSSCEMKLSCLCQSQMFHLFSISLPYWPSGGGKCIYRPIGIQWLIPALPQELFHGTHFRLGWLIDLISCSIQAACKTQPMMWSWDLDGSQVHSTLRYRGNRTPTLQNIPKFICRSKVLVMAGIINGNWSIHMNHSRKMHKILARILGWITSR